MVIKRPEERAKFWRDPALDNLEMLRATYVTHTFSRHTHEGYAVGVIESGVEEFTYQGAVHRAPAGSVVVIHPGEVHTGHAGIPSGWTYRMLYPEVTLVQRATSELQQWQPYFPNPVIQDRQLATQLRQLHIAIETSTSPLARESCFLWTFAQMVSRHADSKERAKRRPVAPVAQHQVQCIQDYLRANYANSISLEQLACIANLKPLRLLRVFRQEVGLPPHAYLVQVRVGRAKALLSMGLPIAQVAADTGFTDQSHLHRHFKRLLGVTPRQYVLGCCKNVQDL